MSNKLERRRKIKSVLGNRCFICNNEGIMMAHEIRGRTHAELIRLEGFVYFLKNKKNFVPMCRKHHILIHNLVKSVKNRMELIDIFDLAVKILKDSDKSF